jgi:hypothetical protein
LASCSVSRSVPGDIQSQPGLKYPSLGILVSVGCKLFAKAETMAGSSSPKFGSAWSRTEMIDIGCCGTVPGIVPGTVLQTSAALLSAFGILRTTSSIATVFESSVFPSELGSPYSQDLGGFENLRGLLPPRRTHLQYLSTHSQQMNTHLRLLRTHLPYLLISFQKMRKQS